MKSRFFCFLCATAGLLLGAFVLMPSVSLAQYDPAFDYPDEPTPRSQGFVGEGEDQRYSPSPFAPPIEEEIEIPDYSTELRLLNMHATAGDAGTPVILDADVTVEAEANVYDPGEEAQPHVPDDLPTSGSGFGGVLALLLAVFTGALFVRQFRQS